MMSLERKLFLRKTLGKHLNNGVYNRLRGGLHRWVMVLLMGIFFPTMVFGQGAEEYIIEHTLRLPKGNVHAAFFTPGGQYIGTIGSNFAIRLWESQTARPAKDIRTGDHKAVVAVPHPKENVIYTGGMDGAINAWDWVKGQSSLTLQGHAGAVSALISGPEGKLLFSGGKDGKIMVWDVEAKNRLGVISAHKGAVTSLALHPDGKHLASGGRDRVVKVWDWRIGKSLYEMRGHIGTITQVQFGVKPDVLGSSSADGSIKIWNWAEKEKPGLGTFVGHSRSVNGFAFHPNEKWLISASQDETIRVWDLETQKQLQEVTLVEGSVATFGLSSSGRRIVAGYTKDRVRTWKLEKSAFLAALSGHGQSVNALAFTRDNQFLLSASADKTVRIWNVAAKAQVRSYPTDSHQVQVAEFSPDDKQFATGGADGAVQIWATATGKVARRLRGHSGKVNGVSFHPTERILVSGGSDKTFVLWNVDTGRPVKRVRAHEDQVTFVDFSPDGKTFATGSDDKTVRIWSYPEGKLEKTLKGHTGGIEQVRYSPDGKFLASASDDGTVRMWDVTSGELRYKFSGHDFIVSALRFAPDGRAIVSVSRDKTVKLWDAQTGKFLRTVSGERFQILALAISPNGKVMATGSVGQEINLMTYPLKVLLKEAEAQTDRAEDEPVTEAQPEIDVSPDEPKTNVDLSLLSEGEEEATSLVYKADEKKDPRAGLDKLENQLNGLMKKGQFCKNVEAIEKLAFDILRLAPYDKVAYHALVNTAVVRQDLKMIYLMSRIGLRALFLSYAYNYDLPQSVDAKLTFWQQTVFNGARERAGRTLELEFVGCDGKAVSRSLPKQLMAGDLPTEAMRIIASKNVQLDFRQFVNLDDAVFQDRLLALIDTALNTGGHKGSPDEPVLLSVEKAKSTPAGVLKLDMTAVDLIGHPARMTFQVRRAKGQWHTYRTDADRRKQLLLPVGNYYLRVGRKVVAAFSIPPGEAADVKVKAQ